MRLAPIPIALLAALFGPGTVTMDGEGTKPVPDAATVLETVVTAERRGDLEAAGAALAPLVTHAERLGEDARARVRFAEGYLALLAELDAPTTVEAAARTRGAFESARALAGPGELRLAATFDAGFAELEGAERTRAHIPEILQGASQAALPAPPPFERDLAPKQPDGENADAPDPLVEARAAYGRAKALLIERLRMDWTDPDTRADLEWIQRRLDELDALEAKRKEREQQQDSKSGEEGQDQESGDQGKKDREKGQQGDEQKPGQGDEKNESGEQGDEQKPGEQSDRQDPGDEERNPGTGEQAGDEQEGDEQPDPQPGEDEERDGATEAPRPEQGGDAHGGRPVDEEQHLTREEVTRLLDRLGEIEKRGEELRSALRRVRRVPVDRDW
ncbi:MAG TPA: hypothetical protein ENJ09_01825 [Planctomycetes bacterium]|nr:hypothetical protein [Planctomycetota bacterium]